MHWILILAGIFLCFLVLFIVIAKKGRELRKSDRQGTKANKASIRWIRDGNPVEMDIEPPFYFGRSKECDVLLPTARVDFEACIFQHKDRFAIQTLKGGGDILVNGQELLAGYLKNGDKLLIAKHEF